MDWDMVTEHWSTKTVLIIKENGKMAWRMVKAQWYTHQEISMKVNGEITNETEKAWWCGKQLKKSILVTGMTAFNQDLEHIFGLKVQVKTNFFETDMLVIGKTVFDMVKESFTTQMDQSMKASGSRILKMDLEFSLLKMELLMKVHFRMIEWSKDH